jgi:hypothetical protein
MDYRTLFGTFRAGHKASAGALTQHAARLRQLTPLAGIHPIGVLSTPVSGTVIGFNPHWRPGGIIDQRLGVIVGEGPMTVPEDGGEAAPEEDFTDERYWVKWLGITEGDYGGRIGNVADETSFIIEPEEDENGGLAVLSPAIVTNLCEHAYGGHGLPVDETKFVWCWQIKDVGGNHVWLMNEAVQPWIKVISDATGNGKYNAKLLLSPSHGTVLDDSDNLTEAMCGDLGTETVFAFNVREVGASTHIIDTGDLPILFAARYIGSTADETPIPCFIFDGLQHEEC